MALTKTDGPGTVVGTNVKLVGSLKDVNDITIHGRVDGEVISDKNVLVGETAMIKGPVGAKIVTVAGKVRGAVTAEEKLELMSTGKIFGSTTAKSLIIHAGAIFVGKSNMPQDEAKDKDEEEKLTEPETLEKQETLKDYEIE